MGGGKERGEEKGREEEKEGEGRKGGQWRVGLGEWKGGGGSEGWTMNLFSS